jgi:cytochrome P450
MQSLAERDFFTDHMILKDPYAYFEAVRERGPVVRLPGRDYIVVTGFDETLEVLKNARDFSSSIAVQGASAPLPFEPQGSDINDQIVAHADQIPGADMVVCYDDQPHSFSRSLISRLFVPSKLKASEKFIVDYCDEMVGAAVARGECELIKDISTPFVTMVIADLLGVPHDDRLVFMEAIDAAPPPGSLNTEDLASHGSPLVLMGMYFAQYVADRRETPREDVLTDLSLSTYPDGTTPEAMEIVKLATFLFGAGQDTSAKLLGNAMRFIVDQPGLQDELRADPSLIGPMLEEVLRLEGSTKMTSRIARRDTRIGDVEVPAGTKILLALSAANRDPRRWENPGEFQLKRPKIAEHVAFGRGAHVCAGAPLARVEVRVILEKFLAMTSNIDFDEAVHGPRGDRNLDYEASFIIRGLSQLHLKLTPAAGHVAPAKPAAEKKRGLFGFGKAAEAAPTRYSTGDSKIGALIGDPAAKAVLDRHFPGVTDDPKIKMAKAMTLRTVQKFAPDIFTIEALDAADAELAVLPVR